MNRREFIYGAVTLTVAMAAASASGNLFAATSSLSFDRSPYKQLHHLEVMVDGAGGSSMLKFENAMPQLVPFAKAPLAIAFEEHDENRVKMTLYRPMKDGSYRLVDYYYAGRDSIQTLMSYNVSLQIRFVDRHS